MLLCEKPEFKEWRPDFSSGTGRDPFWTRLSCNGYELCNSVEFVEWDESNPIQVKVCEACGSTGCASGGYVDITRFGNLVFWTETLKYWPQFESEYDSILAIASKGSVAIPVTLWDSWADAYKGFRDSSHFRPTRRIELRTAWLRELKTRFSEVEGISTIDRRFFTDSDIELILQSQLLACSSIDVNDAIRAVRKLLDWISDDPDAEVQGRLLTLDEYDGRIETLFLDGFHADDWHALGVKDGVFTFAFGGGIVLSPESIQ